MEAAQTSWRSLGELFVERGLISQADLERALAEQAATKRRLADILVRRGLVTGHDITNALMEQLGDDAPAKKRSVAVAAARPAVDPPAAPSRPAPAPGPAPEERPAEVVTLPDPRPVDAPADPAPAAAETPAPAEDPGEPESPPAALPPEPSPTVSAERPQAGGRSLSAHALIAEADSRRRGAEAELTAAREAHAQMLRGLEQVRVELEARDLSTTSLARELEQTQARLRNREQELIGELSHWEEALREAERCGNRLSELQDRFEEKAHELSAAQASAAAWAAREAELRSETESLAGRVDSAIAALERVAETKFAAKGVDMAGLVAGSRPR